MTAPLPLYLTARLAKLLPRLASDQNGEVAATAAAITRTLKTAGLDWHDLAAAIPTGDAAHNVQGSERAAGPIRPFDTYAWKRAFTPRQEAENRARVRFCQSRPWCFSARERAFLADIARLHGNLTIRQGDWLAALTDRLDRELRTA